MRVHSTTCKMYGNIIDGDLADASSEFSWNGAQATLNVGEQFYTYTRTVTDHAVGGNSFNYSKDLGIPDLNWLKYAGQQYFLSGKLEALDSPGTIVLVFFLGGVSLLASSS